MNSNNNNSGLIIVGGILSVLVIIRTVQLIMMCKHRHGCKPYKEVKFCKDVVIFDEDEKENDEDDEKDNDKSEASEG